ncbi:hypothetical protein H4N54_09205 [Limnospira fusiformis KN01]|uniref:Transmembrane protein n=1 Tax=Limnospira fusiformis PMC 851.14 TaxID=2219512 RepID=A0ABU9EEA9_LIMFS|nr:MULTISPECIES: hypothetical protein [Limnospira]MDT9200021.1 hypothetical protein [Limnospira sp. PMC 1042.18]ULB47478.1 hypothetical protein H4N54_09205 [Limnospira fusiformis KN01]
MRFNIKSKRFIPCLHRVMQSERLMVIVKYLLPFLIGVLDPSLSLVVGFWIFLWDLRNSQ